MAPSAHLWPGGQAMQLVALARKEPAPHVEHACALEIVLNCVAPEQGLHVRSDEADGVLSSNEPAAHVDTTLHCALRVSFWNSVLPLHAEHPFALGVSENLPAMQGEQPRSDVLEGAFDSYSPAAQVLAVTQLLLPSPTWYSSPTTHPVQASEFMPSATFPAAHHLHLRSEVVV